MDEQGITCSVGVASSKFVAKLASARCKPDGLLVVPADRRRRLPAPAARRRAVGGGGEDRRRSCTASACTPSATSPTRPVSTLTRALGPASGAHLSALSWGRDERVVVPHEPDKSIGAEHTFGSDVDDPAVIARELLRLSERTAARLRASAQVGRTVSIKVRFADFTTITRARTLPEATDVGRVVYDTAVALYDALGPAAGADPARRRPGRGRRRRPPTRSTSCSSGSASTAGATPSRPSTGRPGASAPGLSGPPPW